MPRGIQSYLTKETSLLFIFVSKDEMPNYNKVKLGKCRRKQNLCCNVRHYVAQLDDSFLTEGMLLLKHLSNKHERDMGLLFLAEQCFFFVLPVLR